MHAPIFKYTRTLLQDNKSRLTNGSSCDNKITYGTCLQSGMNVDGEKSQKQSLEERVHTGNNDTKINAIEKYTELSLMDYLML